MRKVIAWLLVLALTAAISIGATLAYLTDTDEDVNVMTLGKVKIDQLEYERTDDETANQDAQVQEFHDNKPLYPAITDKDFDYTPGDTEVDWTQIGKDGYTTEIWNPEKINNELDKMVFIKNKGDYDAFVRTVFAFEAGNYETLDEFQKMVHMNLNETNWTWQWAQTPVTIGESTYFIATATYNKALTPGALTEISLSQIALDKTATNADVEAFGDTYQILVKTQAIQADGFADPATALNEGFRAIAADNIPWENDAATKGIDLKTALRNYEGNTANSIAKKVSNVVFGLNEDYAGIVDKYDGTLVDIEQDIPVYAYYVPNGSNFDVYFLANDEIFLPKSSKSLFSSMSALKTVSCDNLDTSRTTNMYELFYNCANLTTVDTAAWDVSNVTNMCAMFENCTALTAVNAGNWNTGKVTNMSYMFHNCPSVTTLDVSGWDTAKVTNMYAMFAQCSKVTTLDVSNWDTSNVTNVKTMFKDCFALQSLVGSGQLNLNKATDLYCMFENCSALEYLDVTNWGLENVTAMTNTFFRCSKLTALEGCENWNLSNVTSMPSTFAYDHALADLDVSTWDTSACTDMSFLFKGCRSLTTLAVENWNVSKVKTFASMFSGDGSNAADMNLTHLNLSKWNTGSLQDTNHMFYGCAQLTAMDLSGWDVDQLKDMNHMFADCHALASVNFTGWNTPNLTNMDAVFNHCKSLKSVDLSMFNTSNVTKMCQMFEACSSLEKIIGLEKFNTAKVDDFSEMFTTTKLTELDLSAFNTASAKVIYSMFSDNSLLQTIYVGDGWNMSNATSANNLFYNCVKLVGGNGTAYAGSDLKYACVDTPEEPGYLTYKSAT